MFVCFPGEEEEPVPRTRARSDTASATNGRVLRILIVGPDDEKPQVLDDMRSMYGRMGAKHAVSVGTTITAVENFHSPRFARDPRARARSATRTGAGGEGGDKGKKQMVIFNMVPSRDLDAPRISSDFEAYIPMSSGAVVLVDGTGNWADKAVAWSKRIADVKRARRAPEPDARTCLSS